MSTATKTPKAEKKIEKIEKIETSACASAKVESNACAESTFKPVYGSIVHIEFTVPDFDKAKAFYGELFGWQFFPFSETEHYFQATNAGPCGCVMKGEAYTDTKTMFYVNVDDIKTTIGKATKLGAKTFKDRVEIPGGHGFFAQLRAPEGTIFGIYSKQG